MRQRKRLKRVFIDLEYVTDNDITKSLERIKIQLLNGVESQEYIYRRNSWELFSSFKQCYPKKISNYLEKKDGDKTIFLVKSSI